MSLYSFYRISKPSEGKVAPEAVEGEYRHLRNCTFWGVTGAYALYYVCRMAMSVVKQPLIDGGIFTAAQLGIIGSAFYFVYAFGKFANGFIADYCNVRRFMATGLLISTVVNLLMGVLGLVHGWMGFPTMLLFVVFAVIWGVNGYCQSMGAPPGVISLSRWFPLDRRGTYYSILSATPYLGKALSVFALGLIVGWIGWEYGFIFSAVAGVIGSAMILLMVSDTPESKGLPSVQKLTGETPQKTDSMSTKELHKGVVRHPGIWIIAVSSAFVYITQHAVSEWGVLFLQKGKGFSLAGATQIIAFSEAFGIAGTVLAGWLSDKVFRGNRFVPVLISGLLCLLSLGAFLFTAGGYSLNIIYVSVFSLAIGVVYCTVAGLMALDIVPRKATGAALGVVGLASYAAAGVQNIVSGVMIGENDFNFAPVSVFWIVSCLLCFLIPLVSWKSLRRR
ncbi:MAG: MFS transporter [Bacteroidales bacterium]|nr:MFS transporter [Bacteroidales bacterium]MDY5200370.1 MFS transporter [Candidatus Cryptobacteroides sp.]CCX53079.1 sugar phosphate permease [Alistipes sp. CAG:514]